MEKIDESGLSLRYEERDGVSQDTIEAFIDAQLRRITDKQYSMNSVKPSAILKIFGSVIQY